MACPVHEDKIGSVGVVYGKSLGRGAYSGGVRESELGSFRMGHDSR